MLGQILKVQKFLSTPFGRYLIIGGSVYIFELAVIFTIKQLGASDVLAVGVSFWSGLVISFLLQKVFTFEDKRAQFHIVIRQVAAVSILVLINFSFTLMVAKLLEHTVPAIISRTIALAITTMWNFYIYKTRIFRNDTPLLFE